MAAIPDRAFTLYSNGIARVLAIDVEIWPVGDPQAEQKVPPGHIFRAIWDTGATNTAITTNVVKKCGLQPVGLTHVSTADGKTTLVNTYLINYRTSLKSTVHRCSCQRSRVPY